MQKLLCEIISPCPDVEVAACASDGGHALRTMKFRKPDVILLDLEMPNVDGFTFLKNLSMIGEIPTIVVSAYGENEQKLFLIRMNVVQLIFYIFLKIDLNN